MRNAGERHLGYRDTHQLGLQRRVRDGLGAEEAVAVEDDGQRQQRDAGTHGHQHRQGRADIAVGDVSGYAEQRDAAEQR